MSPWENSLWGEWWQKNFLFHFLTSLVGSLHTWAELALCQSPPCLISSHQPLCVSTAVMWNCLKPSLSHGFGLSPLSLACFSSKPCNAISLSAISISQGNKRKFCVPFSYCSYCSLRTKLVELMEFQLSCFKSWKMMLRKCCTQYASKYGKLSSGHRTGKGQFSFQSWRKAMQKNAQTTAQLHSSHMLVK